MTGSPRPYTREGISMNLDRINIDRRKLLKLAGASMATAGFASATGVLGGCADKLTVQLYQNTQWYP